MKNRKSQFESGIIRSLTDREKLILKKVENVTLGVSETEVVAIVPSYVSSDRKERPLIFSTKISNKILEHGEMIKENFVINANDWDYVLRNVAGNIDKINLIKLLPNGGFIRIGANRINGYFIVTHYENVAHKSQKLKNLLQEGDALDRFGRTPFLA